MEWEALIQKENMSYEFPSRDSKIIVSPPSSSGSLMPGALPSGWAQPHQVLAAPMSPSQAIVHLVRPRADAQSLISTALRKLSQISLCTLGTQWRLHPLNASDIDLSITLLWYYSYTSLCYEHKKITGSHESQLSFDGIVLHRSPWLCWTPLDMPTWEQDLRQIVLPFISVCKGVIHRQQRENHPNDLSKNIEPSFHTRKQKSRK